MDSFIGLLVPIVAAIATAVRNPFGTSPARRRIRQNLELLDRLPEDSTVRAEILVAVDESVRQMLHDEKRKRRDYFGIGLATFFLAGGTFTAIQTANSGNWTFVPLALLTAFLLLFGVVGLITDVPRAERDDQGRLIRPSSDSRPSPSGARDHARGSDEPN